jgi:hypothetical protein
LEWISFDDDGEFYSVTKKGLRPPPRRSEMMEVNENAGTEQDATPPKVVTLDWRRATWLSRSGLRSNEYSDDLARDYFSACGRYRVTAMDSCQEYLEAHLLLWSIGMQPMEPDLWNFVSITNAEKFAFPAAKISINFDLFNPLCVLTFWVQPDSDIDRGLCSVRCFILDLETATITHCLHPITLYSEGSSIPSLDTPASSFNGSLREEWIAQMDMMERSTVLSKCRQYLVLSATLGAERFQVIVDLPSTEEYTSKEYMDSSPGQTNPRVIEPKMTYWREHRYWMSVYHQRVLLHRSVRSVTNRNKFSSLSCHLQLGVLPAHLSDAKTWLLILESNAASMTILVTTKDHPPELWKLQVSWDTVVGKLKDLEVEHGDAIVALD